MSAVAVRGSATIQRQPFSDTRYRSLDTKGPRLFLFPPSLCSVFYPLGFADTVSTLTRSSREPLACSLISPETTVIAGLSIALSGVLINRTDEETQQRKGSRSGGIIEARYRLVFR